jgi:hypothetical protein
MVEVYSIKKTEKTLMYCQLSNFMNKPFLDLTLREAITLIAGYLVITLFVIALLAVEPIINAIFN